MDREEISQLYHRLGPLIYRRCLKLLANPEHARDATQEVFVRMLRHAGKLEPDRQCLPWLYRVATNYCLNQIRNSQRLEFRKPEDLPQGSAGAGSVKRLAARQQVMALMDQMDAKTQQIAVLAHMDGMTQEEIAAVTGLSRKTVGKKLNRFLDKARNLTAREGGR
jgi:RNA polymerase sigma-70 factor (ECF subfamily)